MKVKLKPYVVELSPQARDLNTWLANSKASPLENSLAEPGGELPIDRLATLWLNLCLCLSSGQENSVSPPVAPSLPSSHGLSQTFTLQLDFSSPLIAKSPLIL